MKILISIICIYCWLLIGCRTSKPTSAGDKVSSDLASRSVDTSLSRMDSYADSTAYLKSIVVNKSKYLNKELGNLIKDLSLDIKSYMPAPNDLVTTSGLILSFNNRETTQRRLDGVDGVKKPVTLIILWEKPLLKGDVQAALKQGAGEWGPTQQDFYSKLTIKDII